MSLYGAMMIGVSALDAFSNALSTTSSNIANVNTVGYKQSETAFESLVTSTNGVVSDNTPSYNYNYVYGNGSPDVRRLFGMTDYKAAGNSQTATNP